MQIKDVENLAELAKIELNEEEKKNLLSDMEGILAYVGEIQKVDVAEIKPEYKNRNVWREDKLEERDFSVEIIKEQFPDSKDGFVKVKKIM
jgi:aspartyl-tRNA(Asn)/glutamyl-tRNA(Gln) amidotransferase subunit C